MDETNNSYFNQLKKQISKIGENNEKNTINDTQAKDNSYETEQRILQNIEKEKELTPGVKLKEISSSKNSTNDEEAVKDESLSALDKLKKMTGKPITENTTNIEWIKKETIESNTKNDFKHEFVEQKQVEEKEIKPPTQENINTKDTVKENKSKSFEESIIDKAFLEPRKDSSDMDWLKREIIEEPEENDFNTSINSNDSIDTKKPENLLTNTDKDFAPSPKWNPKTAPIKPEESQRFKTTIDKLFEDLVVNVPADIRTLAIKVNNPQDEVEDVFKLFEEIGIVELNYPTSLSKGPTVTLKKELKNNIAEIPEGKTLDAYSLVVDKVPANISIVLSSEENRPTYCIELPSIGKYTKKFLDFIKNEIAESTIIELEEILDPKKSQALKEKFFTESRTHLQKYFNKANEETIGMLSGVVLHEMYGLGDMEILIGDDMLEEIAINSAKTPIAIYHRIHGWMKTNLFPGTEDDITNFASQIGRKVGREITTLSPILDAHLLSGDRVNATLFPISAEGNTITIRRFARKPWTLIDFIGKSHTMNSEMAALLWLAMQYEMNVVIAGGTASGKTSALNTLLALVPSYHRIISIEDVREIILPVYLDWNWIPMITRSPNPEGLGEVTMLELMVSSLRMRPDRIIVGEIRRKKEAEVLMEAIETGHSIYSTIHANSAYQVLRRLAEPPMSIPLMQIELIDLIVVQFRDRKTNKRRTYEIAEIEQTSTGKGLQVNTVYKWVPRSDSWEKLNKPNKILTLLNLHTGLTEDEIVGELKERENILEWMKKNNMTDVDMIGFIMKTFYANANLIKQMSKRNAKIEEIQKMMDESSKI